MDGVILIDKPAGPTSAEIVRQVKARLGTRSRVGHLGTLDPFASGLLPIMVGEGTKLAPFLQQGAKEYTGHIALGIETDTLDLSGQVVRRAPLPNITGARLRELEERFTGVIEQIPPVFSALKRDGVRLYKLARLDAQTAPPAPRQVEILRLELRAAGDAELEFTVTCSSGMYVRSLARDIGAALGSVAHLRDLRRIRNGVFSVAEAGTLAEVLASLERHDCARLIGLREALPELPEAEIDETLERRLRNGDSRALDYLGPPAGGPFKVVAHGRLVAVAQCTSRVTAAIARIFNPAEN